MMSLSSERRGHVLGIGGGRVHRGGVGYFLIDKRFFWLLKRRDSAVSRMIFLERTILDLRFSFFWTNCLETEISSARRHTAGNQRKGASHGDGGGAVGF